MKNISTVEIEKMRSELFFSGVVVFLALVIYGIILSDQASKSDLKSLKEEMGQIQRLNDEKHGALSESLEENKNSKWQEERTVDKLDNLIEYLHLDYIGGEKGGKIFPHKKREWER